jgi:glycosyltransferase involved in cell wall biosynthesis
VGLAGLFLSSALPARSARRRGGQLRVAHVMRSDPQVYGMQRVLLTELVEQRARGVDASYLVLHEQRMGAEEADQMSGLCAVQGVPVIEVPVQGRFSLAEIRDVQRALEQAEIDVVHTHGYKGDVYGLLAARSARLPVVGEVHGWLFPDPVKQPLIRFYEWLDAQVLKRMDRAIALSHHYRRMLLRMGFSAERLRLVPSGIDAAEVRARSRGIDLRARLGIPPESPTVGMLSRLSHEKGVDLFVQAMAAVVRSHPEVRAVVFGSGPLEEELRGLAGRLGLEQHLTWAGYVDASADALRALDVVAQTSRIEALPQVLMEAMIMERPTVVTPVGGCPELVKSGQTGYVVPGHEPELIAAAIKRLLVNRELARRMGRAGAERIAKEYSMDLWFRRTSALYEELAAGAPAVASA